MIGEDWQFIEGHQAYIKAEAEKEPVAFRHLIEDGFAAVIDLLDGITDEQAAFRPQPEAQNIAEIVQHIAAVKRWCARVCTSLAHGETPDGTPGDGITDGDSTVIGLRLELEGAHERMLDFAAAIWPMTDLTTSWSIPGMPAFNCKQWAVWQRLHDRHHADEIRAIQADGGYPFKRQVPTKFRNVA
jgi:hypothetical protein